VSASAGEETLPRQRRSLRETNVRKLKEASSSDEDGEDDGMLLLVLLVSSLKSSLNHFQFSPACFFLCNKSVWL